MKKLTDKLEELYTGEKQQILLEEESVQMLEEDELGEEEVEEPLPPGEAAGAPEKDPMTGEEADDTEPEEAESTYESELRELMQDLTEDEKKMIEEILNPQEPLSEVSIHTAFGQVAVRMSQGEAQVAALVLVAAITAKFALFVTQNVYKFARECKHIKVMSHQYKHCVISARVKAKTEGVRLLKASLPACKKAKNPDRCENRLKKRIAKEETYIRSEKARLARLPKP